MASRSGRPGHVLDPTRCPRRATIACGDRAQRQSLVVADVEDLPGGSGDGRGEQQALDHVVDVEAVALLRAVAEHRDRLVGERARG